MIDARDIVSIICMFNIDKYNSAEHPTKSILWQTGHAE